MADRHDWDRDRIRGRLDWDRNREFAGERDWDRERRLAGGSGYGESRDWSRGRDDYGRRANWRENDASSDYRGQRTPERDDFDSRGDWGAQGNWGTYGNRADYSRDYEWRDRGLDWGHQFDRGRNEDWGRRPDWGRDQRNERYAGGTQTYGGSREYGRGEPFERERNESDFGPYNTRRTPLYGVGSFSGGAGSFSGGMGSYSERGRFSGRGPKGWQRPDDRIREDVNERLTEHPEVDASEIEVQVKAGEVTLTGTVDTRYAKRMAEDIAENVSGVKDVHNNLRMQPGSGEEPGKYSGTMATSGTGTTGKNR